MKDAEVIQVIRTQLTKRGKGVEDDPIRIVTQYWSLDGQLLAEVDNWTPEGNVSHALREKIWTR